MRFTIGCILFLVWNVVAAIPQAEWKKAAFARWLFQQGDFYRAMTEYQRVMVATSESEAKEYFRLKAAECVFLLTDFPQVLSQTSSFTPSSPYFEPSVWLRAFALARMEKYAQAEKELQKKLHSFPTQNWVRYQSQIWQNLQKSPGKPGKPPSQKLPSYLTLPLPYGGEAPPFVREKPPWIYAMFSVFMPGLGQMFLGEWANGISALLVTGTLATLSVVSFQNKETLAGGFLGGLASLFYAGSVYGAYAEAQRKNQQQRQAYREFWLRFSLRYQF